MISLSTSNLGFYPKSNLPFIHQHLFLMENAKLIFQTYIQDPSVSNVVFRVSAYMDKGTNGEVQYYTRTRRDSWFNGPFYSIDCLFEHIESMDKTDPVLLPNLDLRDHKIYCDLSRSGRVKNVLMEPFDLSFVKRVTCSVGKNNYKVLMFVGDCLKTGAVSVFVLKGDSDDPGVSYIGDFEQETPNSLVSKLYWLCID